MWSSLLIFQHCIVHCDRYHVDESNISHSVHTTGNTLKIFTYGTCSTVGLASAQPKHIRELKIKNNNDLVLLALVDISVFMIDAHVVHVPQVILHVHSYRLRQFC